LQNKSLVELGAGGGSGTRFIVTHSHE